MLDFAQFNSLMLPIDTLMQLAFYVILGIYAVYSAILYYHWSAYGTDVKVTLLTLILYFAITVPLLIVMGILLLVI